MNNPIRWFGGKGRLVKKLSPLLPPHKYYIEVFGGGASLLFAKPPIKKGLEVYNDLNEDLVNFFRVIGDKKKFEEFFWKAIWTPYSRKVYMDAIKEHDKTNNSVDRAYLFFVIRRQALGGMSKTGWGYEIANNSTALGWANTLKRLHSIHKRVMSVQVECLDWRECLLKYAEAEEWNYSNSFIYLDPPYLPETRRSGGYKHELTYEDHEDLIEYLLEHQKDNKFMLSGYDNELYHRLKENGWKKICWDVACNAVGRTSLTGLKGGGATQKNQRRTECVWMNYDPQQRVGLDMLRKENIR